MNDEFDLQTLLNEQAEKDEQTELSKALDEFDFDSAFSTIGERLNKEEEARKAEEAEEKQRERESSSSGRYTFSSRDSLVRDRTDDDYVFMTKHKGRHNPMSSYEAMQALIGNDVEEEEDDFISTRYSKQSTSGGIDWQARLGQKKESRFSKSAPRLTSYKSRPASRSSRLSFADDDVAESVSDDVFSIDWSSFGNSLFSF